MIKCPDYISNLKPYVPGKSIEELKKEYGLKNIFKLASNENPIGPSPKAVKAMKSTFKEINRYPDINATELREKIAGKFNINFENIVVGNGSEGIMANILRSYLSGDDEIITSEATFIGFQVLARGRANVTHFVPMPRQSYKFDLEEILKKINSKTKIIYLCNPNNPTGTIFTKNQFLNFIENVPKNILVIMDEAYFEYAMENENYVNSQSFELKNVISLRTFSKIYGIAGARIGYGFADNKVVETIMKVKLPFEPSLISQKGAIAALDDDDFLVTSKDLNKKGYNRIINEFNKISSDNKIRIIESSANFIMFELKSEEEVNNLNKLFLSDGIIIRPLKPFGLPECFRVTIGKEDEVEAFLNSFNKHINEY